MVGYGEGDGLAYLRIVNCRGDGKSQGVAFHNAGEVEVVSSAVSGIDNTADFRAVVKYNCQGGVIFVPFAVVSTGEGQTCEDGLSEKSAVA